MTLKANRIERYYDYHDPAEEEFNQTIPHQVALQNLLSLLEYLFVDQAVAILCGVRICEVDEEDGEKYDLGSSPDISIIKGVDLNKLMEQGISSYYIGIHGPVPAVTFEIVSPSTSCQLKGVANYKKGLNPTEHFVFAPRQFETWQGKWQEKPELGGWRGVETGQYQSVLPNGDGWLWSEQLDSWLAVDGKFLRLYDREGRLRLIETQAKDRMLEAEQRRADRLAEKLRLLGVNPDEL